MSVTLDGWETESGIEYDLKLNSISHSKVVDLASTYNAECNDSEALLNELCFSEENSPYRLDLYTGGEVIGMVGLRVSPADSDDGGCFVYIHIEGVFVLKKYRPDIVGNIFGLYSAYAIEDIVIDKICKHPNWSSIAPISVIIEAVCTTRGGVNFCDGFIENFQEHGYFKDELIRHNEGEMGSYTCIVDLDTLEAESRERYK